ncbi:16.8 kDa salivary protein [Culex quinquefasciatus]|uniref:16.8 kDa salivary protein n=1 Tax=Culex quinquefasciatus TaxID=7176 RepID=B0WF42_CULQU|nr:16.8 kDa salivary protein [Culex quinquefasciatus]|eukprot:XP_001847326.1 16.8 kDa salivary protein [Culex quinquefasciatus]
MKPILVSFLLVAFVWSFTSAKPFHDHHEDSTDGPTNDFQKRPHRHGVPTGSVKIRSVQSGKYLAGSSPYDRERRTITLESSPEEWSLVQDGPHYRITLKNGNEDLYAFDKAGYNPDSGQREVFTWIPGFGESQGRWEVKEAPGYSGIYNVRNLHFDEYLYTSCCENKALTRKGFGEPDGNSMYLWQITKF